MADKTSDKTSIVSNVNQYADEEVPSSYGYLSGYRPQPVAEQMATLKAIFPQLKSFGESVAAKELLAGAEGNFLIPRWRGIAATYDKAVEIVLAKLKEARNGNFCNFRPNELGPDRLRQSVKKIEMFQKLGDEQKGHDVLVVQAQFGIKHRGKSVRRALVVMGGNECGLGAFEIGIMLLTHPDRLGHRDDLWIDCGGDVALGDDGDFSIAPFFRFRGGNLEFGTLGLVGPNGFGYPYAHDGSPSAFVVVVPSE